MRAWIPATRVVLVAGLVLATTAVSPAAVDVGAAFRAANGKYAEGDYEGAADGYRSLLEAGQESAAVRFNLGNAYYKLHRIGPAILEYERASRLAPGDTDIADNLAFVRTLTADKPTPPAAESTEWVVRRALSLTTPDQDAAILTVLWVVLAALWGGVIAGRPGRMRRALLWGIALLVLPAILVGGTLSYKVWRDAGLVEGIVLVERVDVRSGPGEDHTSLFAVHEGIKIRLRGEQGDWSWISLDSGLNGWIPNGTFDRI